MPASADPTPGPAPFKGSGRGSSWIRTSTRWALYLRDGLRCLYCGRHVLDVLADDGDNFLTIDHLRTRKAGGSHDPSNLSTACYSCNHYRGLRSLRAFAADDLVPVSYGALRSRVLRRRRRGVEPYREAARVLLGRVEGLPAADLVRDHDERVRRQWLGDLARAEAEHYDSLGRCLSCGAVSVDDPLPF